MTRARRRPRAATGSLLFVLLTLNPISARAQDGAAIFNDLCALCHQPNARGVPGQFPPLARNPDLFLARDFPARVVLFGLSGRITVNGQDIDSAMPPLGDALTDAEIAAVVNYVRGNFGNEALRPKDMAPLDAGLVAKLRAQKNELADRSFAYRSELKSSAKN